MTTLEHGYTCTLSSPCESEGSGELKRLFLIIYLPLQIWTLNICNHDTSKIIIARSFKLCQLIEDDKYINW